jgi:hypothetical protein
MSKQTTKTKDPEEDLRQPETSKEPSMPDLSGLNNVMALLAPLLEFHKEVTDSDDGDLRLFWDVRLVRGKNTPYMSTSGSSSLPGILSSPTALARAPITISQEIDEKIAMPLNNKMQQMISEKNIAKVINRPNLTLENNLESDDLAAETAMLEANL